MLNCQAHPNFIVTAICSAVDKAIPKSKSKCSESNPISEEIITLIKERCRLRRKYSQIKDLAVWMYINQLEKQILEKKESVWFQKG